MSVTSGKTADMIRASLLALLCAYLGIKFVISAMMLVPLISLDWQTQPSSVKIATAAAFAATLLMAQGLRHGLPGVRQYWSGSIADAKPNMNIAALAAAGEQALVNSVRAYVEPDGMALWWVAAIWTTLVVWNAARYWTRTERSRSRALD